MCVKYVGGRRDLTTHSRALDHQTSGGALQRLQVCALLHAILHARSPQVHWTAHKADCKQLEEAAEATAAAAVTVSSKVVVVWGECGRKVAGLGCRGSTVASGG